MAMVVMVAHCGLYAIPASVPKLPIIGDLLYYVYSHLVAGEAAVLVFFVISGFCIHYPFRNGRYPNLWIYYPRRHIRILIPCFSAFVIAALIGVSLYPFDKSNLWSVVCEEVYYTIYPLFLAFKHKTSWRVVLPVAYALALMVIATNPLAADYHSYGNLLNPVLGLPVWLLGAKLADEADELMQVEPVSRRRIWLWRTTVYCLSVITWMLNTDSLVHYPWTLTLFSLPVYFWLRNEVPYMRTNNPPKFLESAGSWSYSLYLLHVPLAYFILMHLPVLRDFSNPIKYVLFMCLILLGCFTFYLFIEKPSHWLSRRFRNLYKVNAVKSVTDGRSGSL